MSSATGGWATREQLSFRRRVLETLLLLLLFRVMAMVPLLHVDEEKLHRLLANNPLVGTVNLFAGGEVLEHFSLAAAGILPYLVAFAIVEWAAWFVPSFRELRAQGEHGKERLELYSKLLTIPLAFLFAWLLSQYLAEQVGLFPGKIRWFTAEGFLPSLWVVCGVTAGSLISTFIMELITKRGIGPGQDVILLTGAVLGIGAQMVRVARQSPAATIALERTGAMLGVGLIVVVLAVYLLNKQHRVPLQFAGRKIAPSKRAADELAARSYLPLLANSGRTRPVSAALGLLVVMQLTAVFAQAHSGGRIRASAAAFVFWSSPQAGLYWIALACLIAFFTYVLNFKLLLAPFDSAPAESLADSLKKQGAYIPGIKPGNTTEAYLSRIIWTNTLPGAAGLVFVSVALPYLIWRVTHFNLIVTVVSLMVMVERADRLSDWIKVRTIRYEGLLKKGGRLRARQQRAS